MSRPSSHARVQRDPHGQDVIDFHLDDFPGKPEVGNAQVEHSPGDRRRLENFYRVPQQRQVVSAGQAAYPRAHNGDSLSALRRGRQVLARRVVSGAQVVPLGGVSLERADGDGLVDLAAPAGILARVRADPSQHVGERIGGAGQKVGLFIPGYPDGLDVPPAFRVDGAGGTARNVPVEVLLVRDRYADSAWRLPVTASSASRFPRRSRPGKRPSGSCLFARSDRKPGNRRSVFPGCR